MDREEKKESEHTKAAEVQSPKNSEAIVKTDSAEFKERIEDVTRRFNKAKIWLEVFKNPWAPAPFWWTFAESHGPQKEKAEERKRLIEGYRTALAKRRRAA